MDARLEKSLVHLSSIMKGASRPWWIIGSTAMVLGGVEGVMPDDIDVVAEGKMLHRLIGIDETVSTPHKKFRSHPFVRIQVDGGTDIEFQGDLALWENNQWSRLLFESRIEIRVHDAVVYIPSLDEQMQTFRRFGRSKDLEKAVMIEAFIALSHP